MSGYVKGEERAETESNPDASATCQAVSYSIRTRSRRRAIMKTEGHAPQSVRSADPREQQLAPRKLNTRTFIMRMQYGIAFLAVQQAQRDIVRSCMQLSMMATRSVDVEDRQKPHAHHVPAKKNEEGVDVTGRICRQSFGGWIYCA